MEDKKENSDVKKLEWYRRPENLSILFDSSIESLKAFVDGFIACVKNESELHKNYSETIQKMLDNLVGLVKLETVEKEHKSRIIELIKEITNFALEEQRKIAEDSRKTKGKILNAALYFGGLIVVTVVTIVTANRVNLKLPPRLG